MQAPAHRPAVAPALLFLQYHSFRNRLLARIKRLRQPKYLFGAIVGGMYVYWYLFRPAFVARPAHGPRLAASLLHPGLYESIGALVLMVIIVGAWLVPHQRAALTFSEAEIAFLFPAPLSRRGLLHFKLLRSQTSILFTTFILTLVTNRFGPHPWIRATGWWLILSNLNLHLLGSSFMRTMLMDRGITNWWRRGLILFCAGVFFVLLLAWGRSALPAFDMEKFYDAGYIKGYLDRVFSSGPFHAALYPFRLVVRPYFSANGSQLLSALGAPLVFLLVQYWWVIGSNVAFEEASLEASRRLAEKVSAIRSGQWRGQKAAAKHAPFVLRSDGPRAVALLWKNLINAGRAFTLRLWVTVAAIGLGAAVGLRHSALGSGWAPAVAMLIAVLLGWSLLIGPQFLRQDFRQDLPMADVLKMYPMPGWQIALGELLAPAAILTGIQWFLVLFGAAISRSIAENLNVAVSTLLVCAFGLVLVLPLLNLLILQIPNASVLLFPGWFLQAKEGPHGIEAMGQRIILLLGQLLVFAVALLPAAGLALLAFIAGRIALSSNLALLVAVVAGAVILGLEVAAGVVVLGHFFERLDVSEEQK